MASPEQLALFPIALNELLETLHANVKKTEQTTMRKAIVDFKIMFNDMLQKSAVSASQEQTSNDYEDYDDEHSEMQTEDLTAKQEKQRQKLLVLLQKMKETRGSNTSILPNSQRISPTNVPTINWASVIPILEECNISIMQENQQTIFYAWMMGRVLVYAKQQCKRRNIKFEVWKAGTKFSGQWINTLIRVYGILCLFPGLFECQLTITEIKNHIALFKLFPHEMNEWKSCQY